MRGGVAIYVKDTLSHHKREDIRDPNLEIIGIEMTPKHAKSYIVLCWYCPPTEGTDVSTFEALTKIIKKLDAEGKEIILVGDTNCDYKKSKDCNTRKLKLIYSEFQFEQLIRDFKRVAATTSSNNGEISTSKTIIDHFSTNRPKFISYSGVIKLGMTDHYMIFGIRKLNAKLQVTRKEFKTEFRSMRNYDREAFLFDLQNVDWEMAASTAWDDPNIMASNFYDLFHSILDVHAPLKTRKGITRHAPSPWITPRIKNLIRERDRAKKKAERDRSIWPEYKRLRNRVTSELRRAVEGHFLSYIVGAVLMDLSKAFDCIPHDLLIAKLNAYGVDENALVLIYSYLKRREQSVRINNTYSSFQTILSGVPQGSVLGPILFNVYINYLFLFIKQATLYNYADDNTLSYFSRTLPNLVRVLEEEAGVALMVERKPYDCKSIKVSCTVNQKRPNENQWRENKHPRKDY